MGKAGVKFCICFECRWSSHFQGIKAILDKGLLGTLHYGEVDYYHGIGPWYGQFRWNVTTRGGGSALLTAGCHALDALLLCMGGEVEEVMSYSTKSRSQTFAPYEYDTSSVSILNSPTDASGNAPPSSIVSNLITSTRILLAARAASWIRGST